MVARRRGRRGHRGSRVDRGDGRLGDPDAAGAGGARRHRGHRSVDAGALGDLGWFGVQEIPGPAGLAPATRSPGPDRLSALVAASRSSDEHRGHGRDHHTAGSGQRAEPGLRPRQRRAGLVEAELAHLAASPLDLTATIGGRQEDGRRRRDPGRAAARPRERARRARRTRRRRDAQAAVQGRERGRAGLAGDVLRRPRRDHPQGGRPAGRPVACTG